ncbi:MAG: hypothetical protein WBE37_01435 [Bryobacteraceae bacterium]
MTPPNCIASFIACATFLAVAAPAQENPLATPTENPEIAGLPTARGIYFHAAQGWVALSRTVLMPFEEGRAAALEILNVGSDHATAEIPGPRASVQISNDARPTFYLRGITPVDLYLVRAVAKSDYRELRMPTSRHFREWAHFRAKDVADYDLQPLGPDVVAIKPRADLKAGEYALASVFEPGDRWIRLGYDFGLTSGQ